MDHAEDLAGRRIPLDFCFRWDDRGGRGGGGDGERCGSCVRAGKLAGQLFDAAGGCVEAGGEAEAAVVLRKGLGLSPGGFCEYEQVDREKTGIAILGSR